VPALIADLGEEAAWRCVEFFAANIRNPHTRRAYARARSRFYCLVRGPWLGARGDPAARRRDLRRAAADRGLGAVGQAAARSGADAVRPDGDRRRGCQPTRPGRCAAQKHAFRATGITAYVANGGALEHPQEMAAHESPRTTNLYDRTKEREVDRIRL
jgi:hypothetical protein